MVAKFGWKYNHTSVFHIVFLSGACICEEINNSYGTQRLVKRTCNLIRESASFAARNLSASGSVQPLPQNQKSKLKRPLPGHDALVYSKKWILIGCARP